MREGEEAVRVFATGSYPFGLVKFYVAPNCLGLNLYRKIPVRVIRLSPGGQAFIIRISDLRQDIVGFYLHGELELIAPTEDSNRS